MADDDEELVARRRELCAVLSAEAFVDTCATIGAFNVVDRIADATGIRLDDRMIGMSAQVRDELSLGRFGSSANTFGADAASDTRRPESRTAPSRSRDGP